MINGLDKECLVVYRKNVQESNETLDQESAKECALLIEIIIITICRKHGYLIFILESQRSSRIGSVVIVIVLSVCVRVKLTRAVDCNAEDSSFVVAG